MSRLVNLDGNPKHPIRQNPLFQIIKPDNLKMACIFMTNLKIARILYITPNGTKKNQFKSN